MTKVKCRMYNEDEKIFVNFEFTSRCVALNFFQNIENIEDILGALSEHTEDEEKESSEEVNEFKSEKEQARANLAKELGKLPKKIIEDLAGLLQEVSSKNK